MFFKSPKQLTLKHHAMLLRGAPRQSFVVADCKSGRGSTCNLKSATLAPLKGLPKPLQAIAPHPEKPILAVVGGAQNDLAVLDLKGSRLFRDSAPALQPDSAKWITAGFNDCLFDATGRFLWCAATLATNVIEIQLRKTAGWSVVERATIEAPFGGSACHFSLTGKDDLVAIWLAAGQDGSQVYWLKQKARTFHVEQVAQLADTYPPAFSPTGKALLVREGFNSLCRLGYPSMRQVIATRRPFDEDDPFGAHVVYLDGAHALVNTSYGRLLLIHTSSLKVLDEIVIEGHEPLPVCQRYPMLAEQQQPCTDIGWFQRIGDWIVFVYNFPVRPPALPRRHGLFWLPVQTILNRLA